MDLTPKLNPAKRKQMSLIEAHGGLDELIIQTNLLSVVCIIL